MPSRAGLNGSGTRWNASMGLLKSSRRGLEHAEGVFEHRFFVSSPVEGWGICVEGLGERVEDFPEHFEGSRGWIGRKPARSFQGDSRGKREVGCVEESSERRRRGVEMGGRESGGLIGHAVRGMVL